VNSARRAESDTGRGNPESRQPGKTAVDEC
jgi:hypothetical protein